MILEISNLTNTKPDKNFLKRVGQKSLKFINIKVPEISIVLVGDKKIKDLNNKYRGKNKVTDVLAFDYGEIFICLPRAKKQARALGHSIKKELAILLIHGLLHLAGYEDETKQEYNKMMNKQQEICQKVIS